MSQQEVAIALQQAIADPKNALGFPGVGACPDLFEEQAPWARRLSKEIKEAIGADAYSFMKQGVLNAYYTPDSLVEAVWQILRKTGFKGGLVLEPSIGMGAFYEGCPQDVKEKSEWVGVEIDPVAAQIVSGLYPEISIHNQCLSKVVLPEAFFDLVIGNVPFGETAPHDPEFNYLNLSLHDYFVARTFKHLRPGGLMCLITSSGTMNGSPRIRRFLGGTILEKTDKETKKKSRWVEGAQARLVDAFWLPPLFQGTQVSPVLVIFQKLDAGSIPNSSLWLESKPCHVAGEAHQVNTWFTQWKPQRVLGEIVINPMYGNGYSLKMERDSDPTQVMLRLKQCHIESVFHERDRPSGILIPPEYAYLPEGAFLVEGGVAYQKKGGFIHPLPDSMSLVWHGQSKPVPNVAFLVECFLYLEETLRFLLDVLTKDAAEAESVKQVLLECYQQYVQHFGPLRMTPRKFCLSYEMFQEDPRYHFLASILERPDPARKGCFIPSPVFQEQNSRVYDPPEATGDFYEAYKASLNHLGRIDVNFIASILYNSEGRPVSVAEIVGFLNSGDRPEVFLNPETDTWEHCRSYLSGNVYRKLEKAKDASLEVNVKALQEALPPPMLPGFREEVLDQRVAPIRNMVLREEYGVEFDSLEKEEQNAMLLHKISVSLGASWIPATTFKAFAEEVLNVGIKNLTFIPEAGTWSIVTYQGSNSLPWDVFYLKERIATTAWILERLMTFKSLDVKIYSIVNDERRVNSARSAEATAAVNQSATEIEKLFQSWLWSDFERARKLTVWFNQVLNQKVPCNYDGSLLEFPGMNSTIHLHPYQRDVVMMALNEPKMYMAWPVGAGKSFGMIASIMRVKQLGLAKKPWLVVQNSTLDQIYDDFMLLYPTAKVFVVKDVRDRATLLHLLLADEIDCVLMAHSQFFLFSLEPTVEAEFLQEELELLAESLIRYRSLGDSLSVKKIQALRKRIEKAIAQKLTVQGSSSVIPFSLLVCDMLALDEAHVVKNTPRHTSRGDVKGIGTSESSWAMSTLAKIRLLSRSGGRVILATGTMISNSMTELHAWMQMLAEEDLKRAGIYALDPWLAVYGEISTSLEIGPDQALKPTSRLRRVVNCESLRSSIRGFTHIVTDSDISQVVEKPQPRLVQEVVEPSPEQVALLQSSALRGLSLKNRKPFRFKSTQKIKVEDNYLLLTGDILKGCYPALLARMGDRFVGQNTGLELPVCDPLDSVVHRLVYNVVQVWRATESVRGGQIVFCDMDTPKKDTLTLYSLIVLYLQRFIPQEEIAVVHDCKNRKQLQEMLAKMNSGEIRVVLGSTEKLGTGVNAHLNGLWALHHLDAPWTPKGITQRDGRAIRQGNGKNRGFLLPRVWVFVYIVERMSALRWYTLLPKQDAVISFFSGMSPEVEEADVAPYSFAEIQAMATGLPEIKELNSLKVEMAKLLRKRDQWKNQKESFAMRLERVDAQITQTLSAIALISQDVEQLVHLNQLTTKYKVDKSIYGDPVAAAQAAEQKIQSLVLIGQIEENATILTAWDGFAFQMRYDPRKPDTQRYKYFLRGPSGYRYSLPITLDDGTKLRWGAAERQAHLTAISTLKTVFQKGIPAYLGQKQEELDQLIRSKEAIAAEEYEEFFSGDGRIIEIQSRISEIEEKIADTSLVEMPEIEEEEEDFAPETPLNYGLNEAFIKKAFDRSEPEWLEEIVSQVQDLTRKEE